MDEDRLPSACAVRHLIHILLPGAGKEPCCCDALQETEFKCISNQVVPPPSSTLSTSSHEPDISGLLTTCDQCAPQVDLVRSIEYRYTQYTYGKVIQQAKSLKRAQATSTVNEWYRHKSNFGYRPHFLRPTFPSPIHHLEHYTKDGATSNSRPEGSKVHDLGGRSRARSKRRGGYHGRSYTRRRHFAADEARDSVIYCIPAQWRRNENRRNISTGIIACKTNA